MSPVDLVAGATLASITAYGVLAGADFGGGVWDLAARGPRKEAQREAIAHAIGPVWEANHVWLIFVIVLLFTAFPPAFAALSTGLFIPFHLVLVGITLRGAAFVFRSYGPRDTTVLRRWGGVFGAASAFTPVLLGQCLGAVSSGALRVSPDGGRVLASAGTVPWLTPLALAMGALALALCAYTAAVFLTVETRDTLREDFRRRALAAGTAVVALSVLLLFLVRLQAPRLWVGLTHGSASWVVAAGAVAAVTSGLALWLHRPRAARVAATVQVSLVLLGWGLAQYPYIVYPDVSLAASAAPEATLRFVLWTLPPGVALLGPSLWLLFRVFKRPQA